MLLLEQDNIRKEQVDKTTSRLKFENDGNGKEYKVKAICSSIVYAKESKSYLPDLYYLVSWKGHPEEENIWEPVLAIFYLQKLVITFYKEYLKKTIMTSLLIDSALPMAKPTVRSKASTKQKRGRPIKANGTSKRTKKDWTSSFLSLFGPVSIVHKWPLSHMTFLPACSLIFWFFFHFLVFPSRHWLKRFFYQLLRSFDFLLSIL